MLLPLMSHFGKGKPEFWIFFDSAKMEIIALKLCILGKGISLCILTLKLTMAGRCDIRLIEEHDAVNFTVLCWKVRN